MCRHVGEASDMAFPKSGVKGGVASTVTQQLGILSGKVGNISSQQYR